MTKMRGHIAARRSCAIHGDNGCEIRGEAGFMSRAQEKRQTQRVIEDDIVTHDEVLRWQPDSVRREWADAERARILAMSPEERGWWTREEADADGGQFVAARTASERDPRFYRTGG